MGAVDPRQAAAGPRALQPAAARDQGHFAEGPVADAEEAGATILNGLGMSLYQGAAQIEYWTGQEPPIEAMRQKLLDIISEK